MRTINQIIGFPLSDVYARLSIDEIKLLFDEIERLRLALSTIEHLALWHCDESADVDNTSPDDQVAYVNGLIVQVCRKAVEDGI